jgi:hypothetical protein
VDAMVLKKKVQDIIGVDTWDMLCRSIDTEALIFATEAMYTDTHVLDKSLKELLMRLKRATLLEKRATLKQTLQHAEAVGDTETQDALLITIADYTKQIEALEL